MPVKFIIILLLMSSTLNAQLVIDVSNPDDYIKVEPGDTFDKTRDIQFKEKIDPYTDLLITRGLHFHNREMNILESDVLKDNLFSSPILGVHGKETVLKYTGQFTADGGQAKPSFVIMDSAEFVVDSAASFDLILDNEYFYGRPLYIYGDGTGTLEFEEGFVADLSDSATVHEGIHSVRFSDADLVTHHTQSIPLIFMPTNDPEKLCVYSHIYFDNEGTPTWHVRSNDQEYTGGVVVRDCELTLDTEEDLTVSGVKTTAAGGYTNWGGFMMAQKDTNRPAPKVIKKGAGTFVSSGDNAFIDSSLIIVKEGIFEFQSDPFTNKDNKYDITYYIYDQAISDQNLMCAVEDNATLYFNTPLSRIDHLTMTGGAGLKTGIEHKIDANSAEFDGTLTVAIPSGKELSEGDVFDLFDVASNSGNFEQIRFIPDVTDDITWDFSDLYTQGTIKVASGHTITGMNKLNDEDVMVNYVAQSQQIEVYAPQNALFRLYDLTGKPVLSETLKEGRKVFTIAHLPSGMYVYRLKREGIIVKSGKLISQ